MANLSSYPASGHLWLMAVLTLLPLVSLAQAPTVMRSGLAPVANASTVIRSTTVAVPFSQAIDPTTAGTIRVHSAQYRGQRTVTAALNDSTVTLTPTAPAGASAAFWPGETVRVTVPTTVHSLSGAAAVPYVYQFIAATTGGTGSFTNIPNVAVGNSPYGVTLGDVDSDGDLDMLTANFVGDTVSVRLNDGMGNFTGRAKVVVDSGPYSVATADVDNDGDLDILTANFLSANVSVRLNDGSGTFAGGTNVSVGNSPSNIAVGDVDGDGDLDFVTNNVSSGTVSVRLNDGTGNYTAPTTNPDPVVGGGPRSVALGDIDDDGDLDLLVANFGSSTVSVRLNNGTGSFTPPATNAELPVGRSPEV